MVCYEKIYYTVEYEVMYMVCYKRIYYRAGNEMIRRTRMLLTFRGNNVFSASTEQYHVISSCSPHMQTDSLTKSE